MKVMYKFNFYKASSPPSPSSLTKLPNITSCKILISVLIRLLINDIINVKKCIQNTRPDPSSMPNTMKLLIKLVSNNGALNYLNGKWRLKEVILLCDEVLGLRKSLGK